MRKHLPILCLMISTSLGILHFSEARPEEKEWKLVRKDLDTLDTLKKSDPAHQALFYELTGQIDHLYAQNDSQTVREHLDDRQWNTLTKAIKEETPGKTNWLS